MEAFEQDAEKVMESHMKSKKAYVAGLETLFNSFDDDGSGSVCLREFEEGMKDPRMGHILSMLDIEPRDALALFRMLDENRSGDVSLDEFVAGCIQFRGSAKALQVEAGRADIRRLARQVQHIQVELDLADHEEVHYDRGYTITQVKRTVVPQHFSGHAAQE